MPAAIPLIAGAFLAAGSVATAVGLGTAFIIGATAITWTAVLTVTGAALMAVSMLTQKTMKSGSGSQLQQKLDPQSPLPIVFGRTATGGNIIWRGTWGAKNAFYGIVTALSVGGAIAGIEEYRAGDYPILWSGNPATSTATAAWVGQFPAKSKLYKNKLRQRWQNGAAPASTTPGGASGMPIPIGKLSGVAHVITSYEYNTDAFPQGLPVSLWIIKGNRLYDPRKDSTYPGGSGPHRLNQPSTYEYSENPYVAALQWTLGRWENGKRVYGIGAAWSEVDVASFVTGANVADANGWKIGGQITTADDKFAVLSTILASGGGLPIARGAQIAVTVNAPKASVLTLTRDDVIGEVEIASSTSYRDRQNTIIPHYREETQNWAIISGERVSSPVYVAEDAEEIKSVEVEYPLVQQAAQAHQLAAYELVNTREFLTFNVQCKMRLLAVRVGDAITVDIAEVAAKGRKCLVVGREYNPADQSVTLSLKSETDAKHAFALGQTQVAPPSPKLDGYDPSDPDAPASTAWAITETQISNGTNTFPVIVVSGAADDPNTQTIIAEYRPLGSSQWLSAGEYPRGTARIEINSVTDQTVYEVAISYRTVLNVVGERLVLTAKVGDLKVGYGNVNGTPTSLGDVNPTEGEKLTGIAPGADVTGDNTSKDTASVGGIPSKTVIIRVTDVEKAARDAMDRANTVATTASETTAKAVTDLTNKINTDVSGAKTEAANALASGLDGVKETIRDLQAGSGVDTTARASIRDNDIVYKAADKALADRYTAIEASYSNGGGNLLSNTEFTTLAGWTVTGDLLPATSMVLNAAGETWMAGGENNLSFYQAGRKGDPTHYIEAASEPFAVTGGQFLQFYAFVARHRANAWVSMYFYDANGAGAGYGGENTSPRNYNGGVNIANWDQVGQKSFRVPDSAVRARLIFRKYDTFEGEANSYAWFMRAYVAIVREGQNHWNPYASGNAGAAITQTNASITSVSTALTTKEAAITKRIDESQSEYRDANSRTNTRITDELSTISSATGGLARRATALEVASSAATNTLNPNADFSAWSNPGALPDLWQHWSASGPFTQIPNPLARGGYAIDLTPSDLEAGIVRNDIYITKGWYVMEAIVWRIRASWNGAGVTLSGQANIDFMADPDSAGRTGDSNGDGGVRSWSKLIEVRDDYIGAGYKNWHAMSNWSGFGRGFSDKTLRWMRCAIRPATEAEVKAMKADAALNNPGGLVAKVAGHESAIVNLPANYASAGRANTLESQMSRAVPSGLNSYIDGVNGRIDSVNSTTVTNLNSRIEERAQAWASQEAGAVANRASTLEAQMRREIPSPINSYVDAVNGRIDSVNSTTVTNIGATIEDRASAWARQEAGAVASTVQTLRTEYDRTKGEISSISSVASDAYGRSRAFLQQTAIANGNRAQISLYADSNGGAGVDIIGDVAFRGSLNVGPDSGGNRVKITNSGMSVFDGNGTMRVRLGLW